jgi:signal transduction histidine kinase
VQRRILIVALTAVALAVTLLGTPLAFVQRQYLIAQEQSALEGEAARVAVQVSAHLDAGSAPELPEDVSGDVHLAIYTGDLEMFIGVGPDGGDEIVQQAVTAQHPVEGFTDHDLVSVIPVVHDGQVAAVVRASSPRDVVFRHQLLTVAAVGGAAVFAALLSMLLALRLAWRLGTPIKELAEAAEELGDGNFAVRAPTSGIGELDAVAGSMNATAQRLGQLVDRERAFSSHASHQLRTPLTALRLRLDQALRGDPADLPRATLEAMSLVGDLEATVEDLLAVSRGRAAAVTALDLDRLLSGLPHRWEALLAAAGRRLVVRTDDPPVGAGRAATVRQVLDVLVDNAYRHGGGTVEVIARDASGALAIDVVDEGRDGDWPAVSARFSRLGTSGRVVATDPPTAQPDRAPSASASAFPPSRPAARRAGTGIGLGLARSLVVADGGRLLLSAAPGRTCVTVLLPPADPSETTAESEADVPAAAGGHGAPGIATPRIDTGVHHHGRLP